jgi:nucleoid-associated protein YgaU
VRAGITLALAALTFAASGFLIADQMRGAEVLRVGDAELSVRELRTVESVEGLARLLRDAGIDLNALTASPPAPSADGPAANTPLPSQPGGEGEHLVTAGDTLASIAQQYLPPGASLGAFANAIVAYNAIENVDLLFVGEVIRLPPP